MTDFDTTKSCRECPYRELACSSTCEGFAIRKAQRDAEKQARERERPAKDFLYDGYHRAKRRNK